MKTATRLLILAMLASFCCGEVFIDDAENLTILVYSFAETTLPANMLLSELPLTLLQQDYSTEERLLRGMAYIPIKEQQLHIDYWKQGFPELNALMTAPKTTVGHSTFSAVPKLDVSMTASEVFIYVRVNHSMRSDPKISLLPIMCNHVPATVASACPDVPGISSDVYACRIVEKNSSAGSSHTALLDMFGFIAMQMHRTTRSVYLRIMADKLPYFSYSPSYRSSIRPADYVDEKEFPRVMWPAWLNMYLFLRQSYHSCKCIRGISEEHKCANLFKPINQLSLTYAYFVCRILFGEAGDGLCPPICTLDPCDRIENAIPGTCQTIGFRIHRFDFFCFCENGYSWLAGEALNMDGRYTNGKCERDRANAKTTLIEGCTRLEMETFCSEPGTLSCSIDRMSDNRRPTCNCRSDYSGLDCGYHIGHVCDRDGFKGRLLCRSHESMGACETNKKNASKYSCNCYGNLRMRRINGDEECEQWIGGRWLDRAVRCGYEQYVNDSGRYNFRLFCDRQGGCDMAAIEKHNVVVQLKRLACSGNGECQPAGSASLTSDVTPHCKCLDRFSGSLCQDEIKIFPDWTPWSICYAKGIVRIGERVSLRYLNCMRLIRHESGSSPKCINGETEYRRCPDVADDLQDSLTPSDYGVASQAVISMWRVAELMFLANGLLLLLLAALLLWHKFALAGAQPDTGTDEQ